MRAPNKEISPRLIPQKHFPEKVLPVLRSTIVNLSLGRSWNYGFKILDMWIKICTKAL